MVTRYLLIPKCWMVLGMEWGRTKATGLRIQVLQSEEAEQKAVADFGQLSAQVGSKWLNSFQFKTQEWGK